VVAIGQHRMHGKVMPSKLALERSFVFDASAHLRFPSAAIPRYLLAAIDVTLLFANRGTGASW
jgi:hypothetical protein